jgi:hypothetical protein
MKPKRKRWTDTEAARLQAFDGQPWSPAALVAEFPGRTYAAIERKASKTGVKLGAHTRPPQKHEPHTSFSVTLSLEHQRKFKAVLARMGFKIPSFMRWTIDNLYAELMESANEECGLGEHCYSDRNDDCGARGDVGSVG